MIYFSFCLIIEKELLNVNDLDFRICLNSQVVSIVNIYFHSHTQLEHVTMKLIGRNILLYDFIDIVSYSKHESEYIFTSITFNNKIIKTT